MVHRNIGSFVFVASNDLLEATLNRSWQKQMSLQAEKSIFLTH